MGLKIKNLKFKLLAGVLSLQTLSYAATPLGKIRIGEPFPAVQLPLLADGSLATLQDFRGRRTVLHIFASW